MAILTDTVRVYPLAFVRVRAFRYRADSVIGVVLFGDADDPEFGVFDRAFITLFQAIEIPCRAPSRSKRRRQASGLAVWVASVKGHPYLRFTATDEEAIVTHGFITSRRAVCLSRADGVCSKPPGR